MTDDAEISPLVENGGTTFEVVILSTRTGAPPHCLDNRLRILTWRGREGTGVEGRRGGGGGWWGAVGKKKNTFLICNTRGTCLLSFFCGDGKHMQTIKTIEYFNGEADREHKMRNVLALSSIG